MFVPSRLSGSSSAPVVEAPGVPAPAKIVLGALLLWLVWPRAVENPRRDPVVQRLEPRRTPAGLFGTNVERVLAIRAPGPKRGPNADDEAVVLHYRRYPDGRRSRGRVELVDAGDVYDTFPSR